MDVGSVVLLGHELALRRQVDIIANNLANAQTTGFKRERSVFHTELSRMQAAPTPEQRAVHHVLDYGAVHDVSEGPFQATGNPLDVAIAGAGYFAVALADGSRAFTRAGAIRISPEGFAEVAGARLLGDGAQPIQIPPDEAARASIAADGTISGPGGVYGRIAVYEADEATMDPRGNALVSVTDPRELAAERTRLRVGGLEGSNVRPVIESAELIDVVRAYQSSQRLSESLSDLRRRSIERLGRFGN